MISRVQVLDFPVARPGKCVLCFSQANHDGRKFIDFGLQVERYGAVVFCSHCLKEVVTPLGWLNPIDAEYLTETTTKLKTKLQRVEEENERLRRALSELDFLSSTGSSNSIPMEAVAGIERVEGHADNPTEPPDRQVDEREQGPSESPHERRLEDIFGDDGIGYIKPIQF